MPCDELTLNLPNLSIVNISGRDPLIYHCVRSCASSCVHCGSERLHKKDRLQRRFEHERTGLRRSVIEVTYYKYHCKDCGRYFRENLDGILRYQRSTEPCRRQVFHHHRHGMSRKQLGEDFGKSSRTLNRWYGHIFDLEHRKRLSMQCPSVLGIDEHYFSKKQKIFATTLCDLRKNRVFDVVKGKSGVDLKDYLEQLQGKEKVQVVCMDLSSSYRSIVKKYFPNAKIVSDRFHVVRIVQHHLIKTAMQLDPSLKEQRGMIRLLRKHHANLTDDQRKRLLIYLEDNPAVTAVYEHKEEWMKLLLKKNHTRKKARPLAHQFFQLLHVLKEMPISSCQALARTLESWQEEIGRMWRFTKSNGITEGFHRKIKLIQRLAYGYRNFENYRLRVRVLCC